MTFEISITWISKEFLKNMTHWVAQQVEIDPHRDLTVKFRNRKDSFSGVSFGGWIAIRISTNPCFCYPPFKRHGADAGDYSDRVEALVAIAAHEMQHVIQYRKGVIRKMTKKQKEQDAHKTEMRVKLLFRAQREALMAEWSR